MLYVAIGANPRLILIIKDGDIMLTEFVQLFLDVYHSFVAEDYPLRDYFDSIIVMSVEITAIVGALLFGAVAMTALFRVFSCK